MSGVPVVPELGETAPSVCDCDVEGVPSDSEVGFVWNRSPFFLQEA